MDQQGHPGHPTTVDLGDTDDLGRVDKGRPPRVSPGWLLDEGPGLGVEQGVIAPDQHEGDGQGQQDLGQGEEHQGTTAALEKGGGDPSQPSVR